MKSKSSSVSSSTSGSYILLLLFLSFLIAFAALYSILPPLSAEEAAAVVFPGSVAELGPISRALAGYRDQHYYYVVALFSFAYILLQSFAIPGTIFLSVLAGPLFGSAVGIFLVSFLATSGSCVCYLLVSLFGRSLVSVRFPSMLANVRAKLAPHWHNLFYYLLFLRISPILPNVSISVSAPVIGIPLPTFAAATFIGLMPANYLHLQTGIQLNALTGAEETDPNATRNNFTRVAALLAIAFLALLPTLFSQKLKNFDENLTKNKMENNNNKENNEKSEKKSKKLVVKNNEENKRIDDSDSDESSMIIGDEEFRIIDDSNENEKNLIIDDSSFVRRSTRVRKPNSNK